jgi:hypothetical protein
MLKPYAMTPFRLLALGLFLSVVLNSGLLAFAQGETVQPWQSGNAMGYAVNATGSGLANKVVSAGTGTAQLRRDTILRIRLLNGVNSSTVREGESFNAFLDEAVIGQGGTVLMPRGAILRGRIGRVMPSRFFGKGGSFQLNFDHITLPTGDMLPINLQLASVNQDSAMIHGTGSIYQDPGYANKFNDSLDKSGYLLTDITRKGYEAGKESGGRALGVVTGTFSAIGGALAAGGYLMGKSVYHAVAKGDAAQLNKDDALYVRLLQDAVIPLM